MRVALRHAQRTPGGPEEPVVTFGDIAVDRGRRVVSKRGAAVHLTPREYRLLTALLRHSGKVLTHQQLLKEVWGPNAVRETHYLRVYMAQLRHKLEDDPARPRHFATEPGVGYRLRVE
jgi:two-component system, OmpR family, KDP operon response regulator KdpE